MDASTGSAQSVDEDARERDLTAPFAVSVVVPARDAAPTLRRTLDALRAQDLDEPFEVLIVDDGSRDETRSIAQQYEPFARVLRSERSEGAGSARNRGATVARAPVLAFTDSDCFPTPGWLAAGLLALRDADLVQGAVEPDLRAARMPFDRTVVVDQESGFYPTANLFVRRELFDAVGGFQDWLLEQDVKRGRQRRRPADRRRSRATRTPIGEDTLFAWRGRRLGARTTFATDALVYHAVVPGGLRDEIQDRWHWARDIPGLVRHVPELRETAFYRRWFFSAKTAKFDVAIASVLLGLKTRRWLPLLGAWPYVNWIVGESRRWPARDGLRHGLGSPISDGVTLAGLLVGSATSRCPLL
jgi:glycosyltransferase involved in cell wall biosynthesis